MLTSFKGIPVAALSAQCAQCAPASGSRTSCATGRLHRGLAGRIPNDTGGIRWDIMGYHGISWDTGMVQVHVQVFCLNNYFSMDFT